MTRKGMVVSIGALKVRCCKKCINNVNPIPTHPPIIPMRNKEKIVLKFKLYVMCRGYDPKDHFNKEMKNILIQNLRVNYKRSDELINK